MEVLQLLPFGDYNGNTISNLLVITVEDKDADNIENYLFGATISAALSEIEEFLGTDYEQQPGSLRYDTTEQALEKMDCSELVARFLQKVCGLEEVPHPFYTSLMLSSMRDGRFDSFLQHVKNSEEEDFKDIRPGDVFLWSRSSSDGHTGVVVSYDKETDKVTVIEAIGSLGASEESLSKDLDGYCKSCIRKSIYTRTGKALYKHEGWKGYFRPVTTK
ncbi:CHAP domain-containing protein [Tenuifilum thalassicum]|uniref:CHAP domain-containing protein n=1 Tax=Tenuifilum thalassicum TaxID=2590900 RepID=A0A7D4BCG9_9BACT|nr:CHAP domain-containing protein [Tenuifilum thalassicum]QKG79682.1 CHAP domain-containing protein [Tenuifilum thalassicum]QKG80860.1 CHAP domain-containing protein [Tenuifilum thalassicum]